jgi:hypothetical protein
MSSTTFSIAEQLQIQYSEFEDRLIVVAQLKEQRVKLLLTRRLAMPFITQLAKLKPSISPSDILVEPEAFKPAGQSSSPLTKDNPPSDTNLDPMFLATKIDMQPKEEAFVIAFTGLSLPDAMVKAQPHQPVFAIPFSDAKIGQFEQLMRQQIEKAGWFDEAVKLDPFEVMPSGLLH